MNATFRTVLSGCAFLEAPRWHHGRVWVSDFYTGQVLSVDPDDGDVRIEAAVPGQPSGLGWLPDGGLLVVSMRDRRLLRRGEFGEMTVHADLQAWGAGHLNDMAVDAVGRAYVGGMGFDFMSGGEVRTAPLVRVDPDGRASIVAEGLYLPNGVAILDAELVVVESLGNRLSAFPIDADGGLGERRDWARFGDVPSSVDLAEVIGALAIAPDGICADAEGALWVADAKGRRVLRVREGGEVLEEIPVGTGVYACALGGDDGQTLFFCTAPGFAEEERRGTREARLLATRVDVPAA